MDQLIYELLPVSVRDKDFISIAIPVLVTPLMYKAIEYTLPLLVDHFDTLMGVKTVKVDRWETQYSAIISYIYQNHSSAIRAMCYGNGKNITVERLQSLKIDGINFQIRDDAIILKGNDVYNINQWIKNKCSTLVVNGTIVVYEVEIVTIRSSNNESEKTRLEWSDYIIADPNTYENTICPTNIQVNLLDDLKIFFESKEDYIKKGRTWKRGYFLLGKPGTGKSAIVRAIAENYNMKIFTMSLDDFSSDMEFKKIIGEISNYITPGEPHIVLFDDVNLNNIGQNKLGKQMILNILDGVKQISGRITFMISNEDFDFPALFRPGRIDRVINFGFCDQPQITKILELHFSPLPDVIPGEYKTDLTVANLNKIIDNNNTYSDVISQLIK